MARPKCRRSAAGTSYQGLVTEANTSQTGAQSETIVLNPVDENITGYSSIQASQTVTITDTVLADAVGDLLTSGPINLGTFYEGQPAQIGLDIENAAGAGAAALDVTASSSGQATATGEITQLGAGDTDGSSIQAGIDTSSPGIKTGYVTLDYASDAGGGNTAGAGSQQIEVIGTVYGPATASLSAPIVYVHKGDDGGSVTVPIIISNTGTNNGFTESLNAQIISFGTYVTAASGSFTDLAPGMSNDTSLAATLSDANYGTYAGEVAVAAGKRRHRHRQRRHHLARHRPMCRRRSTSISTPSRRCRRSAATARWCRPALPPATRSISARWRNTPRRSAPISAC